MSRKKIFFPVALFLLFSTVLLSFSFHTVFTSTGSDQETVLYEDSEEVKEFFSRMEKNRKDAAVTIEESRVIASNWIKKERAKISTRFFYRRRSYEFIAKNILTSETYEELNYYLARLPETEKQAYATLTVERSNITTMDKYSPSIAGLLYPIEIPGKGNGGKDLLITSYFSNRRVSPFGSGGAKPHHAVDIINIDNIDYITRSGDLVREGNHPGYVVAAADGVVKEIEYNHIYGWNVTIEHDKNLIPYQKRRGIESFETFYSHLNKEIFVKTGQEVPAGEVISFVGNSGLSTGPHLHYEVRLKNIDGKTVNINPYPGSEW